MKHNHARLFGLCTAVVLACAAMAALITQGSQGRVYSVAAARATLLHDPQRWVGRTIAVHRRLDGCPAAPVRCPLWQPSLFDPASVSGRAALPVARLPPDSWLAAARRLPVLGTFISAPRIAPWGTLATYRVQIRVLPVTPCLWYLCEGRIGYDAFTCDTKDCYTAYIAA